jgi:hypothetical protein
MRKIPIRGLSCKIGPEHVQALKEKESWAVAMLRQIQNGGKKKRKILRGRPVVRRKALLRR